MDATRGSCVGACAPASALSNLSETHVLKIRRTDPGVLSLTIEPDRRWQVVRSALWWLVTAGEPTADPNGRRRASPPQYEPGHELRRCNLRGRYMDYSEQPGPAVMGAAVAKAGVIVGAAADVDL